MNWNVSQHGVMSGLLGNIGQHLLGVGGRQRGPGPRPFPAHGCPALWAWQAEQPVPGKGPALGLRPRPEGPLQQGQAEHPRVLPQGVPQAGYPQHSGVKPVLQGGRLVQSGPAGV